MSTRDLDEFVAIVYDRDGAEIDRTTPEKRYVVARDDATYKIDTGQKILGEAADRALHQTE